MCLYLQEILRLNCNDSQLAIWQRHVTTDMRPSMTKDMFYWILTRNRFSCEPARGRVCVHVCFEMTGNMAVLRWPRYTTADELILSFHLNVTITCYSMCVRVWVSVWKQIYSTCIRNQSLTVTVTSQTQYRVVGDGDGEHMKWCALLLLSLSWVVIC